MTVACPVCGLKGDYNGDDSDRFCPFCHYGDYELTTQQKTDFENIMAGLKHVFDNSDGDIYEVLCYLMWDEEISRTVMASGKQGFISLFFENF